MQPEMPFLAAGAFTLMSAYRSAKSFPPNGLSIVVATVALVIVASATGGTRFAPAVRAFGMLALLVAVMTGIPAFTRKG